MDMLALDIRLQREAFRLEVRESIDLSGITAVFGANGSGKTTLLRAIAGLEPQLRGNVQFCDEAWQTPAQRVPAESRQVGYVFQDARLFAHLTVEHNLRFPQRHGRRAGSIDFDMLVRTFELQQLLDRYPLSLSGGERQRVAIARALMSDPKLLLMDEPLSSIDVTRRRDLLQLIRQLPDQYGIPIIYVTHDVDELVYLADTVVLMADGRNVARGGPQEILARADIEEIAELREPGSVVEAAIEKHEDALTILTLPAGTLRIPRIEGLPGRTVRLRIRPRDVILATEPVTGLSIRNCLQASIEKIEAADHDQKIVRLLIGDQLVKARVTLDATRDLGLSEGQTVYALIKTVALEATG